MGWGHVGEGEREKGDGETGERYIRREKRETEMYSEQESSQETKRAERKPDRWREEEKEVHPCKESERNQTGNVGQGCRTLGSSRGTLLLLSAQGLRC